MPKKKASARIVVRQVKSGIGSPDKMRKTLEALGLKHHQDVVTLPDNDAVRGMIAKVDHLVTVAPAEE